MNVSANAKAAKPSGSAAACSNRCRIRQLLATAFSLLVFTKVVQSSGFFLKKKPPCSMM
jgi:hypothetical protein